MTSHHDRKHSQHSAKTLESGKAKSYKSPQRKLVRFFEKSRDQWKAKCLGAKTSVKRLSNRVRFLEKGKDRLKDRMRGLEADIAKLKVQVRARDKEIEGLKKTLCGHTRNRTEHSHVSSGRSASHVFRRAYMVVCVLGPLIRDQSARRQRCDGSQPVDVATALCDPFMV